MNTLRLLAPSAIAFAFVSCATDKGGEYDTSNPYGVPDAGQPAPVAAAPSNPVYDTPAAYEESGGAAPAPAFPETAAAASPASAPASAPSSTPASAHGPATIHTVVKGDTLSGISTKYKVPIASIKQANHMTNDIVVLGRKLVIPAR